MKEMQTTVNDLRLALDENLNARPLSKSISTLLLSKRKTIDFSPYYQRNYVWDTDKGTFFIESILLGIEIPPLIMFIPANDKKKYEVIDGRQRFETLKRFYEGDFKLTKKGLRSLSGLKGLNFQNLKQEFQSVFLETTIRIIEFSTIGNSEQQDYLDDRIKKEIFWRYNSGITPLKTIEVQRAKHLDDQFTAVMEKEFLDRPQWLDHFKKVFFAKPSSKKLSDAECQARIRELIVLEYFPINIYASTSSRRETAEWLYDLYVENAENRKEILDVFIKKTGLLYQFFLILEEKEWRIYQSVYWALVILGQNDVDVNEFFDEKTINNLADAIRNKAVLFIGDDRNFSKITNQRFRFLADFFKEELANKNILNVDFDVYLKSRIERKNNDQAAGDVEDSISQLANMRLNRPDAVTKTIEDLISDMSKNKFLIRPAYQRQEVINIKKASSIIESMLLGIPLPTIFICRRTDGVCEVVDGQQRLLSILAFLGESYRDNHNREVFSVKNNYKLFKKITILTELRGKKYDELEVDLQDRIWDFELSVVYIDGNLNKLFDPTDFFIRLNNKPYPVKDHSFEMWNSYSERSFIKKIKKITNDNKSWFYYRKDNKRMDNEELLSIFSYLSDKSRESIDSVFDVVDMYGGAQRSLTFRISKLLVTEWLRKADGEENSHQRKKVLSCIDDVESFIRKIEVLARSFQLLDHGANEGGLQQSFNKLLGLKGDVRRLKPFYMLWFLLLGVDKLVVDKNAVSIVKKIEVFFKLNHSFPESNEFTVKEIFKKNVEVFWDEFKVG